MDDDKIEKLPVEYIGRRPEIKDCIYNTGLWLKGQVKNVPVALAQKMAKLHIDVYALVSDAPVVGDIEVKVEDNSEEIIRDQDARDHVENMNELGSIKDFIKRNFNQELPHTIKKIETAKERAVELIDRFGMPQ